ncbi:hypothetical protein N0V88_000361 [Collariella sp. IMI 366227]|nr:hypothetical protein N0V88_000361 [Collariella sp. IMI 366227]
MAGPHSPGSDGPTYAPPNLPAGWIAQWDASSKRYYYVELGTGSSQWDPPTEPALAGSGTPVGHADHPYKVPGSDAQIITHPDGTKTARYPDGRLEPVDPSPDGTRGAGGATGIGVLGAFSEARSARLVVTNMAVDRMAAAVLADCSGGGGLAGSVVSGLMSSGHGSSHGSSHGGGQGGLGGKLASQLASNLFSSGSKPSSSPQNFHGGQSSGHSSGSGGGLGGAPQQSYGAPPSAQYGQHGQPQHGQPQHGQPQYGQPQYAGGAAASYAAPPQGGHSPYPPQPQYASGGHQQQQPAHHQGGYSGQYH